MRDSDEKQKRDGRLAIIISREKRENQATAAEGRGTCT